MPFTSPITLWQILAALALIFAVLAVFVVGIPWLPLAVVLLAIAVLIR